jgi:hypothetical protein
MAERVLRVVGSRESTVRVRLGRPRRDRSSGDYFCPFAIEGLEEDTVHQAWGMDSMQALQSAMQAIRLVLAPHTKRLRWDGREQGSLGFPMAIPEIFGVRFSRRLERMVEQETNRFGRSLERAGRGRSSRRPARR